MFLNNRQYPRKAYISLNIEAWNPATLLYMMSFIMDFPRILIRVLVKVVNLLQFLKIFEITPILHKFFMAASKIRTKTSDKYLSKINVKYKNQKLV